MKLKSKYKPAIVLLLVSIASTADATDEYAYAKYVRRGRYACAIARLGLETQFEASVVRGLERSLNDIETAVKKGDFRTANKIGQGLRVYSERVVKIANDWKKRSDRRIDRIHGYEKWDAERGMNVPDYHRRGVEERRYKALVARSKP
ncbi:hypothetical protein ACFL2H_00320 [Planctomycetota bacterium]